MLFLNHKQGIKDAGRVPETTPFDGADSDGKGNETAVIKVIEDDHQHIGTTE